MDLLPDFLKPLEYLTRPFPREAAETAVARRDESIPHLLHALEWAEQHPETSLHASFVRAFSAGAISRTCALHGHIFMTSRIVDEEGNFSKTKIRNLDDRKLGPIEIERIRDMWEMRCNRALRKAGLLEGVSRRSLKAQRIERLATQHLGPKATAMTRNGCRPRTAETNWEILSASRRMAEIDRQLQHLKTHAHRNTCKKSPRLQIRTDAKSNLAATSDPHRSTLKRKTYGVAVRGTSRVTYHRNRPAGNYPRTRFAHSNPARELADLLARGASIGRIAPGHYFRGGQLLVGFLRTLRAVVRILEIEQRQQR
jgi:hypothetical protein